MPPIEEQKKIASKKLVAGFLERFDNLDETERRTAYETMIQNVLVRITLEDMKRWAEWAKIDLGELK